MERGRRVAGTGRHVASIMYDPVYEADALAAG